MTESEAVLQDILDGVQVLGRYSLDYLILKHHVFYQSPTIICEADLKRWAIEHNIQYEVDLIAEPDQPASIMIHFLPREVQG
jgi:hypothetical protein